MKNTIFSGYIWEKYSHISPQYDDMTGMVDPLPVTSAGTLKINSNVSNEAIGKFEPIKQYYLWTKLESNATKGIVTCKRKPSEITLNDIVGFYLVDCDGSISQEYIGIENIRDKEREGWVSNISDTTGNYDTLELVWEEDGDSGIDIFGFECELVDVDIDDVSSNNLEDYCFNFSNSGTITITLTNLANYALRDDTLYPINLYDGTGRTFGFDLYKYGSIASMSRLRVNTIGATQISGEQTSATATFEVSSAGLYYVKCTIGTNVGTSSGYYFSMGPSDLVNYYPCDIICDWSLHVEATETMPDSMCVSVESYLNHWYEKSGNDINFSPQRVTIDDFNSKFGWSDLDSGKRILYDDNNAYMNSNNITSLYPVYPCHSEFEIFDPSNLEYDCKQLISVRDITDFQIFESGLNGQIVYPNNVTGTMNTSIKLVKDDVQVGPLLTHSGDLLPSSPSGTVKSVNKLLYQPHIFDSRLSGLSLSSTVISDNNMAIDTTQKIATVGINCGSGSYTLSVRERSWIKFHEMDTTSVSIDLNNQWRDSTTLVSPLGPVFESFSNYNVNSGVATMKITISGYDTFKVYIRSYGEPKYDYVMISQLDKSITGTTSYSNTTYVKAHTYNNSQSGNAESNYTPVEYTNIGGGTHTITIVYRKDSSVHQGSDRGYVIVGGGDPVSVERIASTMKFSPLWITGPAIDDFGVITKIDYSGLNFVEATENDDDGDDGLEETFVSFKYTDYILRTGGQGFLTSGISLQNNTSAFNIYGNKGDFISLDGVTTYLSDVVFGLTASGTSNSISFASSSLSRVWDRECYFRVPIKIGTNLNPIYLCFRVTVNSDSITTHTTEFGDCTVWVSDSFNTNITLVNECFTVKDAVRYYTPYTAYPEYILDGDPIDNMFAHGRLSSGLLDTHIFHIRYSSSLSNANLNVAENSIFSLIPPLVTTMDQLYSYLHGDPYPKVYVSDGLE